MITIKVDINCYDEFYCDQAVVSFFFVSIARDLSKVVGLQTNPHLLFLLLYTLSINERSQISCLPYEGNGNQSEMNHDP